MVGSAWCILGCGLVAALVGGLPGVVMFSGCFSLFVSLLVCAGIIRTIYECSAEIVKAINKNNGKEK